MMKKKGVLAIGLGALAAGVGILAYVLGEKSSEEPEPGKKDKKWYEELSDEELKAKRDEINREYCASGRDLSRASMWEKVMYICDEELSRRAWKGKTAEGYPSKREHGWYLPNDD